MTTRTSIMVQPPAATDLWQIADLWVNMQEELSQTVEWRRPISTPPKEQAVAKAPEVATDSSPRPAADPSGDASETDTTLDALDGDGQKAAYEQQLRAWYRDPAVFMLVGMRMMGDEGAGEVVAFMVSRLEDAQPRYGRIIDLYVQPSLRGNNLAKHMVEAASGWMRAQKCQFLEASTLTSNRAGMAFLASTEFQLHSSVLRKRL